MLRKLLVTCAIGLGVLALVVLGNGLRFRSRQLVVAPAPAMALDADVAERLAAALRLRTVSNQDPANLPRDEFLALHRQLEAAFPLVHRTLRRESVADLSLLYTWAGRDPGLAPLLLLSHLDVVPVDPATASSWTHPPFAGEIAEGYVWGRGALDDKVGVIGLLEATERLVAAGFRPRRTIHLAFGHDEEVGGGRGATSIARLLADRKVAPEFVLDEGLAVTEGIVGGISAPVALIGIAEKGYLSVELVVESEGGHSSTPPRETAVGILAAAINALERHPAPATIAGPVRRLFEFIGPEMDLPSRVALANLWLFGPIVERRLAATPASDALLRTTTAPTMLEGSVKENVLPARVRAVVNFRIRPGDSMATVLDHVRAVVADPRVRIAPLEGTRSDPSPESSVTSEGFRILQRTIGEVFPGVVVAPSLVVGATDSRHYAGLGADVYRFLPYHVREEDLRRVHGIDERLAVADYEAAVRFYARLIENAAGP